MASNKDYYKILGVNSSCSPDELKKAFRKLSKEYHPDAGGDENKFKEINEAYSVLSDPEKKAKYDRFGSVEGGDPTLDEFIKNMYSQFGHYQSSPFDPFRHQRDSNGFFEQLDVNVTVDISLEYIYKNEKANVLYNRNVICTKCDGSGFDLSDDGSDCLMCNTTGILNNHTCKYCRGTGRIHSKSCQKCKGEKVCNQEERMPLSDVFRHRGQVRYTSPNYGHFSKYYTDLRRRGNLNLTVIELPHNIYRKGENDCDLHRNIDVDFRTAILGGKVKFTHLDGKDYEIMVPAKSDNGKIVRIPGKGLILNIINNVENRADLYLTFNIIIDYKDLTEEQVNKIKSL